MKKIIMAMVFIFCLSGCQAVDQLTGLAALEQKKQADKVLAQVKCRELCQAEIINEIDIAAGPCLSNEIIPNWVCDIAHDPRQAIDDDPANQCDSFRTGQAHHFVEVDGNCNLLRVY